MHGFLLSTFFTLGIAGLLRCLLKLYENRSRVNRMRNLGLPMPPWSWIFGHLLYLRTYLQKFPADIFFPVAVQEMCEEFSDTDMFYLDFWPFATSFLLVNDPNVAMEVSSGKQVFPKPPHYKDILDPVIGGPNLLTMNGPSWKSWRTIFNPAFSMAHMMEQVPEILESVTIFCQKLEEKATSGCVFPLEEIATRLTMDIIIKVAMDDDSNYQNEPNPLADSLRSTIVWSNFGNPLLHFHPVRPFALRYYGNIMNKYISRALQLRLEDVKREIIDDRTRKSKSVLSLALKEYVKQHETEDLGLLSLDAAYVKAVTIQMRVFLFAGHDTTTSILVYTYHVLSKYPNILQRMREEHNTLFGTDPGEVTKLLTDNPSLLNQLQYTIAVVKETMRMYPPAGAERAGISGVSLYDRHNTAYPTDDHHVSIQHYGLHHHPRLWPRVDQFLPERWLVEEGHELYPPVGAFRVFEHGARNCIGQNLSLLELRIALVMTVRKFEIRPAYEEWDKLRPVSLKERLFGKKPIQSFKGERAYQVEKGAAHPKDQYPCTVKQVL